MTDRQYQRLLKRIEVLERREPPLAGEFVTTATDPADDLLVIALGWDDGEHTFGPVRWSPVGGALPEAGDECVIVERDDGVWQVVAWWSSSQGTGVAQSAVDALDTRLDALETYRTVSGIVAADGSESSSEFSVTKNGTGDYTVTFTTAFAEVPAFVATPNAATARILGMDNAAPTASAVRVVARSTAGTATDTAFHFNARGLA